MKTEIENRSKLSIGASIKRRVYPRVFGIFGKPISVPIIDPVMAPINSPISGGVKIITTPTIPAELNVEESS